MDRIGPAGGSPTLALTNGQQGFQDENLGTGVEGTEVVAAFMNAVQEEFMTILAAAEITPNIANFGQVLQALQSLFGATLTGGTSGWAKLSNGLIIQWGNGTFPTGSGSAVSEAVVFPTTFPSYCAFAIAVPETSTNSTYGGWPASACSARSGSGATFVIDNLSYEAKPINVAVAFSYFAIGY